MGKKTSAKKLYMLLCKNHPDITVKEDENLNIEYAVMQIVKKCWYDTKKYYSVKEIQDATGVSLKSIYRYATDHNFKNRKTIKYDKQNVQSIKHS